MRQQATPLDIALSLSISTGFLQDIAATQVVSDTVDAAAEAIQTALAKLSDAEFVLRTIGSHLTVRGDLRLDALRAANEIQQFLIAATMLDQIGS